MDNTNGLGLKYTTRCKLLNVVTGEVCGFPIIDHPLNVEIIGQPNARVGQFIEALGKHVRKKHPEAWDILNRHSQHFFGYLVLSAFDTPDPNLKNAKGAFEQILRRMLNPPLTNEHIASAVGQMDLTKEDPVRDQVISILQYVRDYYEGMIPQQAPAPAGNQLVTP